MITFSEQSGTSEETVGFQGQKVGKLSEIRLQIWSLRKILWAHVVLRVCSDVYGRITAVWVLGPQFDRFDTSQYSKLVYGHSKWARWWTLMINLDMQLANPVSYDKFSCNGIYALMRLFRICVGVTIRFGLLEVWGDFLEFTRSRSRSSIIVKHLHSQCPAVRIFFFFFMSSEELCVFEIASIRRSIALVAQQIEHQLRDRDVYGSTPSSRYFCFVCRFCSKTSARTSVLSFDVWAYGMPAHPFQKVICEVNGVSL